VLLDLFWVRLLFGQQIYRVILGGLSDGASRRRGTEGSDQRGIPQAAPRPPTKRTTLLRGRELLEDPVEKTLTFGALSRLKHCSSPTSKRAAPTSFRGRLVG